MTTDRRYRLGRDYVDTASRTNTRDQFLRWINLDGSGMGNTQGIRPLKYIGRLRVDAGRLPSYLILVTHEITSGRLNPWDDIVDLSNAEILYWGDAKYHEKKVLDDFKGNSVLRGIYDYSLGGQRELVPPILHFSKPRRGIVRFNGLCCLDHLEISWFDDHGKPVRNYRAKLTILDCEEVSVNWLHHRVLADGTKILDDDIECPPVWRHFKRGRKTPIDIWQKQIRSTETQLPPENSDDQKILDQLTSLKPDAFEKVIVSLFRGMTDITHHVRGTKATGDGGFDFFGSFKLPRPVGYEIRFRGEVKRYSRTTAVDPKSVSRLVARLSRQEYGIFVTTSYFTVQAQKEVLTDAYPVHLISGGDLVYIMKHQRLISRGLLNREWLKSVLED